MSITDPFTEAASEAAEERWTRERTPGHPLSGPERMNRRIGFTMGAKWAASLSPTDAEINATARALNHRGWTCFSGAHEPGEYDQCETCRSECRSLARAALIAARDARTGETR